jgi:Amt family ammonium transporter
MIDLTCDALPAAGCPGGWGNDENGINFAHTAFILVCMALVNLMTPGLSFFYGGLVCEKSIITIMFQSYISMGIVMIVWVVVGFSMAFGADEAGGWIGSPATYPMFSGMDDAVWPGTDIPSLVFAGYQGMFAVITPALMTGAFAGTS